MKKNIPHQPHAQSVNFYMFIKGLCFFLLMFIGFTTKAQETPTANKNVTTKRTASPKLVALVTSLDSFRNKMPVEKVHLHFDKPYYTLGDTIWFKAYAVNESNELSQLSKTLYVDLVDEQNVVKKSVRLPVTQGLAWSSIALKDSSLVAGNYRIHAYTNWMRNLGTAYAFNKAIKIGDALANSSPNAPVTYASGDISVQFFPEGGDLVNNLTSKVSFKVVAADGLSREASGIIVDKNNKQVATFRAEHAGMGTFTLKPVEGNTYTAVVKLNDGYEKRVSLPVALQQGYVMTVTQDENNVAVKINVSDGLVKSGNIVLVAQANHVVQYTAEKELISNTFSTVIPKNRFPEGVTQFTLFSSNYQPVAERLVFVQHPQLHLNIKVTPDKQAYKTRDKVHLNVEVTDKEGTPVFGSFSVAITDETKVPYAEKDEITIFSNLLLTSDLKGYVEQPNYYFTDNPATKTQQLDNLMLTQGWRKFVWKDVLANNIPNPAYKVETGVSISGRVLTSKGNPAPNVKVYLLVNSDEGLVLDTVSDADGRFKIDELILKKGTPFNVMAGTPKGSKSYKVEIDPQNTNPVVFDKAPVIQPVSDDFNAYLENSRRRLEELKRYGLLDNAVMLNEVSIRDRVLRNSASLLGPGKADQSLTFLDLLRCDGDLIQCLQFRLNNVAFMQDSSGVWRAYARRNESPMATVVDGIMRQDMLNYISTTEVASVEVLRGNGSASLYGLKGANGVIVITTKKGDIDYGRYTSERFALGSNKADGLKSYTFNGGYDLRREFYSPDYSDPKINTQMADLRTTIFWNANMMTNESGKAGVDYYNADGTGNYKVIVEGLDLQGRLGRQVYRYNIKY
jgi:TonB-dependent SusC/RagA subfamily outer membrane receptor